MCAHGCRERYGQISWYNHCVSINVGSDWNINVIGCGGRDSRNITSIVKYEYCKTDVGARARLRSCVQIITRVMYNSVRNKHNYIVYNTKYNDVVTDKLERRVIGNNRSGRRDTEVDVIIIIIIIRLKVECG